MSVRSAAIPAHSPTRTGVFVPADTIAVALVWLTIASSAVVFFEPAPFDAMALALIPLLPLLRVARLTPSLTLYLGAWLVIAACGLVATFDAEVTARAFKHTMVTFYLSVASFSLATFVAAGPERHARVIMSAYSLAALVSAMAAIVGYLNLVPGVGDLFTEFGRGRGTFKDPNVFGAFLAPAILYALHVMISGPASRALLSLCIVPVLVFGVLISYSRGAWVNLALSLAVFGYLSFIVAPTLRRRFSLILFGLLAVGVMIGVLVAALQFRGVSELLSERAAFTQDYDVGSGGRFAGQLKALDLALEHPLGIGAREFSNQHHTGDVHNVYLSMFLNAGWLGGMLYLSVVIATLLAGFVHTLRNTATRGLFIVVYAAFVGTAGEGVVIDSDHWRQFFVLLALIWGLMAARSRPVEPIASGVPPDRRLTKRLAGIGSRRERAKSRLVAAQPAELFSNEVQKIAAPIQSREIFGRPWAACFAALKDDIRKARHSRSRRALGAGAVAPRIRAHLGAARGRPASALRARAWASRRSAIRRPRIAPRGIRKPR